MALYQVDVSVHTDSAERSIKNLRKGIEGITTEFEKAEIGAEEFIARASDLSKLNKELKDARGAVANIDKAYSDLDKALASMQRAYGSASQGAAKYHKDLLRIAEESYKEEDRLLKQRMAAERKAFDERLEMAIVETRAEQRRSKAIADFNAGMGARGAVPAVSSPVRGGASQFGSPAYFDALNKDLAQAINEGRQLDAEIAQAAESRQQAIANFLSGMGAKGAVPAVASSVQGSVRQTGSPAYFDALNKDLREAIAEGLQIDAEIKRAADSRAQAIAEFRAGMGAKGAIPLIASPVRGGIEYGPTKGGKGIPDSPGSPEYLEAIGQAAKTAKTIKPSPDAFRPNSLADYENRLKVLQKEARLISPDSNRWRELNKEILKAEKGIQKIQKRQSIGPSAGQRVGAAGGAFLYGGGLGGGIGSAVGGVAGGLAGGVPGAFAGAAIGQVADNLGTALAGITSQASAVQRIQRGLAMASVDAKDFAQAQAAVGEMSQKLLIPLEQTSKFFTQLRANTKEYNLSVDETRQILEGTVLAIMATGGSAEDLDGAMRAVVQIMSKGGVQAEELRGQLGERFPGAVVKFAQANKLSFEQLQDGLEKGTIGIKEFINFAKKNYADYGKFSEQLATAPEYAGQRLAIALEQVSLAIGSLFTESGADLQDLLTGTLNDIRKFVLANEQELKTIASGLASLVTLAVEAANKLGFVFKGIYEVFKNIANVATVVRNMTGSGDIQSVATERQTVNTQINEAFQTIASTKNRPGDNAIAVATLKSLQKRRDELNQLFTDLGGNAAYQTSKPSGLTLDFGGKGAGMSLDRAGKEDKKKKEDSLENFERLRDQLANAYNQAEIERIKARYELEKRLREDLYDMQEFGANRLQRQNLQFLRALAKTEQERQDVAFSGQLSIAGAAGKVSPSAAVSPSLGGASASNLTAFTSQQLAKATQNASRFTGVANMCSESVKAFYESLGISLPGVTAWADTVRKTGQTMTDWSKLQAGDIVATGRPGDTPHVGVYTGGQNVFHQSRKRGLKAGNYPDLSYFQQQGYFVRPTASAGAPRKVGSNESRDTMTVANAGIAKENAALADRGAILIKESSIVRELGRYMQEVYNVPDLTLDNQLLKERNNLMEQGIDESVIDYKMRLFELDLQYKNLLKVLPLYAKEASLSTEKRKILEAALAKGLEASKDAEKNKNDEILRGISIQERSKFNSELAMARALTPDQEMRAQIAQEGYTGQKAESEFQERKILEGAQKLKQDLQGIASTIGDSFGNAFKGIITGSMTAQQALAGFFQSIGDSFADMAAKMISEWLKVEAIKGIQSILGMLNPAGALGGAAAGAGSAPGLNIAGMMQYANAPSIAPIAKFATGGIVKGPTLGLVGEGRYNEAVVPLPDGKSIPVDLSGMGGGAGAISTNIVINVSNGQAQSNSSGGASDLGRKMEGAVKQVIVSELRPGGLLAGGRR